jgi:uncharacterized protein (TIGR02679 family)
MDARSDAKMTRIADSRPHSMAPPNPRLHRLLGGPQLNSLRLRLRRRFEQRKLDAQSDILRIGKLTPAEHAALAGLLGRPQRFTSSMSVDLHAIDTALRNSGLANSLRDALEELDGPLIHLPTARADAQARWREVVDSCTHPRLVERLRESATLGLLKRLSGGSADNALDLCRSVEAVLGRLPAHGITRAQLAAEVLGDAHALDGGRAIATLVLTAYRRHSPDPERGAPENRELRTERSREVWANAGVLVNELASPALFLNLPTLETASYGQILGEPAYASLRLLMRSPPRWDASGRDVFVCENPNLLAVAASALGKRCAPLVCTNGMPAAAQQTLLQQLAGVGAKLRYHGDFDWAGITIGNYVIREFGATPWRFGKMEYETAGTQSRSPGHQLNGTEVIASWDRELAPCMRARRIAIAEEAVAGVLLEDLEK